ncbi:hypothetical protein [Marinilabilia salmonicolor]|uniref:hypothetical protein n=1 Tax=Marinilabilia salmonicolor TaxID=989 RepID=UPI00029A7D1D|nr:hypothetical protein [Marinilabilia salmonicolor]
MTDGIVKEKNRQRKKCKHPLGTACLAQEPLTFKKIVFINDATIGNNPCTKNVFAPKDNAFQKGCQQ